MKSPLLPELTSFIDSLPEPHIVFDLNYRIVAANGAYRRSFGEDQRFDGRTCFDVSHHFATPCDQAGEVCPLKQSLKSGQRERVLHLHQTPRGEEYFNIELSPLRNESGDIMYFVEKMEPLPVARGISQSQGLVGRSPSFKHMLNMVARVARSEATVLLLGESGTGKELVAKAVHDASARAHKSFVAVDCAGLTETLFESELFGHERGAFTGAVARRIGLIESASGGTLFLDEAGDIPLSIQVKLLRLMETGTYRRVGSTESRAADIRLISATHRDLRTMVASGGFRQDLYYRLNTFPISLPPLRERREDLPILIESLLKRVASGRNLKVSKEALDLLLQYDYPGNIRELRNILERASLLCDGKAIFPSHLAEEIRNKNRICEAPVDAESLDQLERKAFLSRVARHDGNRKTLAKSLGISERTLYRRLRKLDA